MPFKSEAQRRWMYANHPDMAKRWEAHTPEGADLPEHVKKAAFFDELRKLGSSSAPGSGPNGAALAASKKKP